MPLEKAAILLLSKEAAINPKLLWALLIKNCLYYASERLSINKEGLRETLGKYLNDSFSIQLDNGSLDEEIKKIAIDVLDIASGKEVLLIKSFPTASDILFAEIFRFMEDCSKKLVFFDDKCLLSDKVTTWTVLFRTATNEGMMRLLEDNPQIFKMGERLIHAPANNIEDVEETLCAKAYSEICNKLWASNKDPLKCLHCGKAISERTNHFIEIDNRDSESAIGCVHKDCLKPIDRVLGTLKWEIFDRYDFLKKFDVVLWSTLIINGQGLFNSLRSGDYEAHTSIGWSSNFEYDGTYNYCIKLTLEDGSYEYLSQRGKILRFKELEAKKNAEFMNTTQEEARRKKNPFCFTSKKKQFGLYNLMIAKKDDDEKCLECLSAEPVQYNTTIGKLYNLFKDYYAPLCMLLDAKTEEFITINDHVVFITDPLRLKEYLENWKRAQIEPDEYEMKIIESDKDFDNKMRYIFSHGLQVIVNPLIDQNGKFIRGISIVDLNELVHNLQQNNNK